MRVPRANKSRSRGWAFTINNYTDEDEAILRDMSEDAEYMIIGKEVGENNGVPHLQGYVFFKYQRPFDSIKKSIPRAHLEKAKANALANYDYCSKGGNYVEYGTRPRQGQRNDIDEARQALRASNKLASSICDVTSYQAARGIELMARYCEPKRTWKTNVAWFFDYRDARAYMATLHGDVFEYVSSFQGYDGHEIVFMNHPDIKSNPSLFMALFGDLPRHVVSNGGTRQFVARHIIVVSSVHPQSYYVTPEFKDGRMVSLVKNDRFKDFATFVDSVHE